MLMESLPQFECSSSEVALFEANKTCLKMLLLGVYAGKRDLCNLRRCCFWCSARVKVGENTG